MGLFSDKNKGIIAALEKLQMDASTPLEKLPKRLTVEGMSEADSALLKSINTLLEKYQERVAAEVRNIKMINEAVSSGMWNMYINKNEDVEQVYWSNEFRKMIGYRDTTDFPDKLESWSDLLHKEDKAHTLEMFVKCIKDHSGRTPYDVEYRLLTKDRGYQWYRATGKVLRDEKGAPLQIIGIFIDITQERENKAQLDTVLRRYEAIDAVLTEGSWNMNVVNHDPVNPNNPFWWSAQFRKLLGYRDETDFPNKLSSWSDALHPEDRQRVLKAFEAHMMDYSDMTPYDVEYRLRHKDGSYRWFKAVGRTIREADGTPLIVAGAIEDITELKNTKEMFEKNIGIHIKDLTSGLQEIADTVKGNSAKMHDITGKQDEVAASAKDAQEKVYQALGIIKSIQDIASQTNMLSLNASIEAARAGAMGKGFAVVAEEVRSLAQTSDKTSRDISDSLQQMQKSIDFVLKQVQEIQEEIQEQNVNLEQVTGIVDGIHQKAIDINEITKNILQ